MSAVFRASRWSRGNFIFRTSFEITKDAIVRRKRGWFSTNEETMHLSRVASVGIKSGIFFADVRIESSGGGEDLVGHGLWKKGARAIRDLIQEWQTKNLPPGSRGVLGG